MHARQFRQGSRRPVDGDLVSYALGNNASGRPQALDIRFAGQRCEQRAPLANRGSRIPRATLGVIALATIAVLIATHRMPWIVAPVYLVMSIFAYLAYSLDKSRAQDGGRRTPEKTLHLFDLLCGWPGGLIAQEHLRHKTRKSSFQAVFVVTAMLNVMAVGWLVHTGVAGSIARQIGG